MSSVVLLILCILVSTSSFSVRRICPHSASNRINPICSTFTAIANTYETLPTHFKTINRIDENGIYHLELYDVKFPSLLLMIPSIRKRYKPIAKTGSRTYSSRSKGIDDLIDNSLLPNATSWGLQNPSKGELRPWQQQLFHTFSSFISTLFLKLYKSTFFQSFRPIKINNLPVKDAGKYSIGLFVYMWVDPLYRNKQKKKYALGDYLLQYGMDYCRQKGDQYMLLVHDDNGRGKLIEYYQRRGFVQVDELLEKGMICKL